MTHCAVCNRPLSSEKSIELGCGPVCYQKKHGVPPPRNGLGRTSKFKRKDIKGFFADHGE